MRRAVFGLLAVLVLGGCAMNQQFSQMPKGTMGAAAGATIGGITGGMIGGPGAIVGLMFAGAGAGFFAERALDQQDAMSANDTLQATLENNPSGTPGLWQNADNKTSGVITPTRTYRNANNQFCRDFTHFVRSEEKTFEQKGNACRDETYGVWILQDSPAPVPVS